ncbi:uncharacterized protein [Gossypium hirsutum]|uniref:Ig-like domain-containing protein n=1 Tax=Gossypium hirsutum TaxID=3635 RepID=A0ABM2YVE8_GOSHI|nr:uncharacterized protein LOC121207992 [Gossypium hirsutum]
MIAAPLTKLRRKGVPFSWTDKQQESFEKLKKVLTEVPVLIQPESRKEFTVYSYASDIGLGCVLMQEGKVWTELLKDYDCSIEYHPGKVNVVADALSQRAISDLIAMFIHLILFDDGSLLPDLQVKLTWTEQIKKLVSDTEEKVKLIRNRLKEATGRQKSYADLKCKEIKYSVGDYVFLKTRFSMLRHYHSDPTYIVPVEEIEVTSDLTFEEEPVQILDCDVKGMRRKSVPLVKVLWRNHS